MMAVNSGKPKIPPKLKVALLIFTLASGAATAFLPQVAQTFGNGDQPTLMQLALTGLVLIFFTSILLAYASKAIGLNRAWLILALTYNALIILVKFVISPSSLYGQTFTLGIASFDPNDSSGYIYIAIVIMLLYMLVFKIIHGIYAKKVKAALQYYEKSDDTPNPKQHGIGLAAILVLGVVLLVGGGASAVLMYPLFLAAPTLNYLNYAFAGMGLVMLVALGVAVFSAIFAFDQAKNTAIETKDGAVLASFLWLGLSLILIYHILWVIYMTVMLSIWPFKTISPSGK